MLIPDYVILLIICTVVFLVGSVSVLLTFALIKADLTPNQRQRYAMQVSLFALVWFALVAGISYSNALVPREDFSFPLLGVLIVGSAVLGNILLTRSITFNAALDAMPVHWLAVIQIYRVIGVIFLLLHADGLLSAYFALSTGWGDIAVGVTAPVVGFLLWKDAAKYRIAGYLWCAAGIGDLLFVLYRAINSAPGPLQTTAFDIPTVIIGYFPFPLIPLLVVPISLILHFQMIRKLVKEARREATG